LVIAISFRAFLIDSGSDGNTHLQMPSSARHMQCCSVLVRCKHRDLREHGGFNTVMIITGLAA
jgi:hypothetical protein